MAGQTFLLGEQKIRPGTFVRVTNIGEPSIVTGAQGVAAAVIKASWGPLNKVVTLEGLNEVTPNFGYGRGPDVLRDLFRGGARRVLAVRVGNGGLPATITLKDTEETEVVKLDTLYETSRAFKVTLRDSLDITKRQLLVYDGTTLLETINFDKGDAEPDALVDAVNGSSVYLKATKLVDGNGKLAAVTDQQLMVGSDPTVTGESYVNGFTHLEAEAWNILTVDSEEPSVHAAVQAFVYSMIADGKRVFSVIGEPTSVSLDTRMQNSRSFNDPAIVYVGNGFVASGEVVEGARAAARVAGEILRSNYTASLTHHVIQGATDIVGKLTNAQIEKAIQSGMLVFTPNPNGQINIEYGITTFITPTADYDEGWR
ncbi:MAG: phage tail protein, partial [Bacillaceae bacterium G1]